MSVQLAWYQEPSVILIRLIGAINPVDYHAAVNMVYDWMEASEGESVHVIVDSRELLSLPSILEISKSKLNQKPGVVVSVGLENKLLRSVSGLAMQILKVETRFVDSFEEAVAFLQKVDSSLANLSVREPQDYIDFDSLNA